MTTEYQREYQRNSPKAKEGRKRYYEKNKERWVEYSRKYRGVKEGQARAILSGVKHRAKAKNLKFDLTLQDILDCPEVCPVLGIEIKWGETTGSHHSPSVDRIDPKGGYTKDNCRLISSRANSLKRDSTIEELLKIVDYMKKYTNST